MMIRTHPRRRGLTIVESTLVLGIFLMFLLGIFEYCRFLMTMHIVQNAARDGARYAAVNVNCPASQVTAMRATIIQYTKDRMGPVQNEVEGLQVAVYPCDQAGLYQSPPVVRSKTTDTSPTPTYPDPFNPSAPFTPAWNSAAFSERLAVTVKGTYRPVTPWILFMPSTIPITVTSLTGSEG
jgi:Flp pilus assembly protein TadG